MVFQRFIPVSPYNNGVIKNTYKSSDDIKIDGAPVVLGYAGIYRENIFDDSEVLPKHYSRLSKN